ncbi:Fic family protein [Rhizobium sp.]|uniref:Fic/DOC family protein n=1 Tax=Rhizobium sp. TaxID=391 RepID=UPI00289F443A
MAEDRPTGSYTYPNISEDPDKTDVLRNKQDIRSTADLRAFEYRATAFRIAEILEGDGPVGRFDTAHLKAIHGHIFQDVYEWAGHTRNESPVVDGHPVEPIGGLSKGQTAFLHGSRIEMGLHEALKPISDANILRGASKEEFMTRAAQALGELNYVHPFREGNGRTQETFVTMLGARYGHDIDLTVISKTRMIEASIASTNDPSSPALKHVLEDASEPNRREAMQAAFSDLREAGEDPLEHNVRTARIGEEITGQVLGHDNRVATLVTDHGIVAADRADLPDELPSEENVVRFTARSDFSTLGRAEPFQAANPQQQIASEQDANERSIPDRAQSAGLKEDRDGDDFDR